MIKKKITMSVYGGLIIIYNKVLSADEMLQNYNALRKRFGL